VRWQEIIEFLGGAAVFGAVIAYLGKAAIDAYISGRVAAFKEELQRLTTEHSVRFQRLHSERAEAIRDFYVKLAQLEATLSSTLAPFQPAGDDPLPTKVQAVADQYNQAQAFFLPRRVFFEERTCVLVDQVFSIVRGVFIDITEHEVDTHHLTYRHNPASLKERHESWKRARSTYEQEFSKLKQTLEDDFRSLLGIGSA
jgi:hypothetical protein